MKKTIIYLLMATSLFSACKKDELIIGNPSSKVDEITYEVDLQNATTWHGSFMNENAKVVGIDNAPNHWKYTFKNTQNLIVLNVTGYTDGFATGADAHLKIFINGSLVASSYSSSFPQAQYVY
ncbi:MAG: hypothetical protein ABI402_07855 [Ferruginibacter sp.]